MAAPHIPNLNTLRTSRSNALNPGRGLPGGRSEGRGSSDLNSREEGSAAKDKIVQLTDQDASVSRLSAVELGYLDDPFAHLFVAIKGQRRFPIINRGTYIRTTAIDRLTTLFLSQQPSQKKQIISLGAGSDTRFFRLTAASASASSPQPLHLLYHELDFPTNTTAKIATISRSPALTDQIPGPLDIPPAGDALHSPTYHIHPCDLRLLPPSSSSPQGLQLPHIDPSLPTLLISECCLCYLPPTTADAVATHFSQTVFPKSTPLALIIYEPINPLDDAFGKVMVANLATRGIQLRTLQQYSSLEAQRARLARYGFCDTEGGGDGGGGGGGGKGGGIVKGGTNAKDVNTLWEEDVSEVEKERVAALEMVDEVEEWRLLAAHYCVAWGWRDGHAHAGTEMDGDGDGESENKKVLEGDGQGAREKKRFSQSSIWDIWKKSIN